MNSTTLAELICTRINHDLIGNVGAVANAVELLEEGDMDFIEDIHKILKTSSFTMSARLKFFRLAFGMDNTTTGSVSDLAEAIRNYLKTIGNANTPISLELDIENPGLYKAVLLLVMTGADLFIKGGSLRIKQQGDEVELVCASESAISLDKAGGIKAILDGTESEPNAKFAPVYYLQEILTNLNYSVVIIDKESFGLLIEKG